MLVGLAVDRIASNGDLVYLERAHLNAKQVMERLRDLQGLPPMSTVAEHIDPGERFFFLDCMMLVARGGINALENLGGGRRPTKEPDPIAQRFLENANWDPALRIANRWYDRLTKTLRIKDRETRTKELDQFVIDLKLLKVKIGDPQNLAKTVLKDRASPEAMGKALGNIMVCLLIPAVHRVQYAADRSGQIQHNLQVAFALSAYKADHGGYPMKLEALAPRYLPQIPRDAFSGKPLIYRPSDKGYLLYSVGINGRDDEGRTDENNLSGDDIVVRMPVPEWRRR